MRSCSLIIIYFQMRMTLEKVSVRTLGVSEGESVCEAQKGKVSRVCALTFHLVT